MTRVTQLLAAHGIKPMRKGDLFIVGGDDATDDMYFGVRRADGTKEWLTPYDAAVVHRIHAKAKLRRRGIRV